MPDAPRPIRKKAGGAIEFTTDCPGGEVFNHLTSRWGLLIVITLMDGPLRFHMLRDRISGISEKMLSQTLKLLARDGLVQRSVEPTNPPRVTYALTPLGQEPTSHLRSVIDWLGVRMPDIEAAQKEYDQQKVFS